MKHPVKRLLSAILVLAMCLSLLSGLTFAATVDYQTGNPAEGYSNVILNWGTRGTTATFLSPNAEAFYSDNKVTYSKMVSQSGSATVANVPDSALYQSLQDLMESNHQVITSYADTRPLYSYTDCQGSTRDKLTCFYSGISIGPDWDSGKTWNREHTWPNSKGMEGSDEDDIMMLRPASTSVNSSRGNKPYGESDTSFDPNLPSAGKYDLHGDVARIALYIYVRWGNTEQLLGQDGVIESLDVLLRWMEEDPVDTWEMGRNDSVESITGTRNVFVDYPELAFALFDQEIPTDMDTPSGEARKSGMAYTISAVSNNDAWGTVSISGKTVNAFPTAGYRVAGYTLVSGKASVIQNGNAFSVDPSSDCTVRIDFEPRRNVEIRFLENGTQTGGVEVYIDNTYTLPKDSITLPDGYTFKGWITQALTETSEKPAQIYAPGTVLTATEPMSYHALYTRTDTQGSGNSTAYEQFSGTLEAGRYLLTHDGGALKSSVTNGRLDFMEVTPAGNTIDEPDASIIWELAFTDDGYATLYNKSTDTYAGGTGAKNKAGLLNGVTDYAKWTVTAFEGDVFDFVNLGNANKGVNKTLRRNADFGFACYADATGGPLTLYKQASGTLYYSTTTASCSHGSTTEMEAVKPTCTEQGYTAGVFCNDCKSYISGHAPVPAAGHSYESIVTAPTETEQGYTTHTCIICSDTYTDEYTEPLGSQYKISFVVPQGVTPIADMMCGTTGITLPTVGAPSGDHDYTFIGWTDAPVEDTDTIPNIYTGHFKVKEETTLYALYTYITGASESVSWQLVTDVANLNAGDKLVMAEAANGKVASEIYSQYLTGVDATFSEDGTIITTLPDTAVVLTLGESEGFWTLANATGQLLGVTGAKKVAWDRGTFGWSITLDENAAATVASSDEAMGRFLYNVKSPRFTTYTSDTNVSMLLPRLYKLEGSLGTTYYTTCGSTAEVNYYLFGYINGANYACEEDYENMGEYLFVDGQLTATFTADSYVGVKTAGNGAWFMTNGWLGNEVTSAVLYDTAKVQIDANKLFVPGNVEVIFTLTENDDGSLTLSYANTACEHRYSDCVTQEPTCETDGSRTYTCVDCGDTYDEVMPAFGHSYNETSTTRPTCEADGSRTFTCFNCDGQYTETLPATGHNYEDGKCTNCGAIHPDYAPTYYLFGFINGANYACEEDYENMGEYLFVDGQLTATFTADSYVGVKTEGNGAWYMTNGWLGNETTSAILYDTSKEQIDANKLFVPGNVELTFTLVENLDGTLTLRYQLPAPEYTVSFVVPEGVEAVEDMTCGEAGIPLPTAGVPTGEHEYVFAGWVEAQVEDTTTAPTLYTGTYNTQSDVTLYALYTYTVGGSEGGWKLVTDAADLAVGDDVVMAQNTQGKVASEITKQYFSAVDAVFSEDGATITELPDSALILTLGQSEGLWTLVSGDALLGCTAAKKLAWDNGTYVWTITIDEANAATIATPDENLGRFLFNVSSPRFTTYTSATSASMLLPQLYKKDSGRGTTYYTTGNAATVEPEGVTISGTVASAKDIPGTITVELWAEGAEAAAYTVTTEDGTYTIEGVAAGTYTMKVSKVSHVTREYTVNVGAEDVTQDAKICLIGDVTGDGRVNAGDVGKLFAHVKDGDLITDAYILECANANGGSLNIGDVATIYAHVKGSKMLF